MCGMAFQESHLPSVCHNPDELIVRKQKTARFKGKWHQHRSQIAWIGSTCDLEVCQFTLLACLQLVSAASSTPPQRSSGQWHIHQQGAECSPMIFALSQDIYYLNTSNDAIVLDIAKKKKHLLDVQAHWAWWCEKLAKGASFIVILSINDARVSLSLLKSSKAFARFLPEPMAANFLRGGSADVKGKLFALTHQ